MYSNEADDHVSLIFHDYPQDKLAKVIHHARLRE